MKCPLTWEALVTQSGEVKRPERPCPHTMDQIDDETWSCPMHGRVTVIDAEALSEQAPWEKIDTVLNGHRTGFFKRLLRRG